MAVQKSLQSGALDAMVLDLFSRWDHAPWFWRGSAEKSIDNLLRSTMTRSTQMERARHGEEPILNWITPEDPRILFVAAMVYSSPVEQAVQANGLHSAIVQKWEPCAINQAFTWMQGHNSDNWRRCQKLFKAEMGLLQEENFLLLPNLSQGFQAQLSLCRDLGIVPSEKLLRQSFAQQDDCIADIGILL
jgi:hypothetical protein